MTVHSNGATEVVTTVVTTTSPQTKSNYNITKYQIHSEKIILIPEFSISQYKNNQVLDSLEWSKVKFNFTNRKLFPIQRSSTTTVIASIRNN